MFQERRTEIAKALLDILSEIFGEDFVSQNTPQLSEQAAKFGELWTHIRSRALSNFARYRS